MTVFIVELMLMPVLSLTTRAVAIAADKTCRTRRAAF